LDHASQRQARRCDQAARDRVLGNRFTGTFESSLEFDASTDHRLFREIRYVERNEVGYLYFDF
jgi:hypothetical protein